MNPLGRKYFIAIAVVEGLIFMATVLQLPFRGADMANPHHLIWFIATLAVAALAQVQYLVRSMRLPSSGRESDPEAYKQIFITSLMLQAGAIALCAIGPHTVDRLLH